MRNSIRTSRLRLTGLVVAGLAVAGFVSTGLVLGATAVAQKKTPVAQAKLETERGFLIHSRESAPPQSVEVLDWYVKTFQFVPNLGAIMAESPALLRSY
jgi:hypothetical protein